MPNRVLRACRAPHCPFPAVRQGRCAEHLRVAERARGTRQARGYGAAWDRFRTIEFPNLLLDAGILPICGARLQGGPSPYSQCARDGRIEMDDLHLDHDPPLLPHERSDPTIVCNPLRVGFLCGTDHRAKTRREMAGGDRFCSRNRAFSGPPVT